MLRIEVLGHFAAFVDGAPLNLAPMSTSVRLWHYLLLRGPGPRRRLHVARELWPEEEDTRGLATLRRHLHVLLRGLPPAEDDKPWLILDRSTLRWNIDSDFTLDVAEYEALLAGIEAASPTQGPGAAMASLEQAAALYAGDLLPESYDDWVLSERERLRQLQCEALFRLVGLQASRGRPRRAIATASRLVGHDPLFEEGHRLLMGLQYLAGDRGAALHAYRQGEAVLAQELGVEPLPATVRLAAAVQGGEAPGQIFALLAADLPRGVEVADLVPGRVVHNLPARESRFVGRRNDLEAVGRMLREHRLTTLTGPAGCGKTRLALELASGLVAADVDPAGRPEAPGEVGAGPFPDGIWWVDLAAVAQADQVAPAVATVLGASTATGAWSPDAIARNVAGKTLLLVLDNCEHIIAACAAMAHGLLRSGPGVRILATSRELLGVVGEAAWVVPPLYCPPAGEGAPPPMASAHEGLLLFEDRARRVRPAFRIGGDNAVVVAQVCRRLDGLPLAIELAAAQMRSHTLAQLADGLPGARDPPARGDKGDDRRHGTLAAAIDWSHDLLSAPEQGFLRRLAVFRGGCSLEAAAAVCTGAEGAALGADEILSGLVDKSLVAAGVSGGEGRFRLLDTMRRYAAERLAEAGEEEAVRHRHAAYFLALAEAIAPRLLGHGQLEGLDRLEADHANLQAALAWHARPGGDAAAARRLAVALWRFWILHSHFQVGGQWLGRLAPAARGLASPVEARLVWQAGSMAAIRGDADTAKPLLADALEAFRRLKDREGEAWALNDLGLVARNEGDLARAGALYEESLALKRRLGLTRDVARSLANLGELAWSEGDLQRAKELYEEALRLDGAVEGGLDQETMAGITHNLGEVARWQLDLDRSVALYRRSLGLATEIGDRVATARALAGLGGALAGLGRVRRGVKLLGAAAAQWETAGTVLDAANREDFEAMVALARSRLGAADWQAEWEGGRALSRDEAVALGLAEGVPPAQGEAR